MSVRAVKLLQVAKHFSPDRGGIETVTKTISDMLVGSPISADVLCTAANRTSYPALDLPYRVIRTPRGLPISRNKSISLDYIRHVATLTRDYDIALVHLPNPIAMAAMLAGWRKPIVGIWHADIPQAPIRRLATPLERAFIRRCTAIIGPTPIHLKASHVADALVRKGQVIPFPFIDTLGDCRAETALGERVREFLRGRHLILATGRMVPYKGFDRLLEAARTLDPNGAIVLVGEGPLQAHLAGEIKRLELSDRVLMTGHVEDDELADLLRTAAIGCMPSVTAAEMYGIAQIEMFSFGKPMVSTNIPGSGVPYVNRHDVSGIVVPPCDVPSLALALNRLLRDDELRRRLGAGAKQTFRNSFAVAAVRDQYVELLSAVASGREVKAAMSSGIGFGDADEVLGEPAQGSLQ